MTGVCVCMFPTRHEKNTMGKSEQHSRHTNLIGEEVFQMDKSCVFSQRQGLLMSKVSQPAAQGVAQLIVSGGITSVYFDQQSRFRAVPISQQRPVG